MVAAIATEDGLRHRALRALHPVHDDCSFGIPQIGAQISRILVEPYDEGAEDLRTEQEHGQPQQKRRLQPQQAASVRR